MIQHTDAPETRRLVVASWIFCMSGFLQHKGRPNGITRLWRKLYAEFAGPDCVVDHHPWNFDPGRIAEFVWRYSDNQALPKVLIVGYSWGGSSAVKLAEQLQLRGIDVAEMILVDAVYRHKYWCGQWRAFWPWSRILIPSNVLHVSWFRQDVSLPRGHRVIARNPDRTKIEEPVQLYVSHQYVDEHALVEKLTMQLAESL